MTRMRTAKPKARKRKSQFSGAIPKAQRAKQTRSQAGAGGNSQQPLPEFAPGQSIAWYAIQTINHQDTLLGDRYLCRSGGMFIVAPSGMGKSTLSIQIAILWCCGLIAFGIKPRKALRILIVQSEDDQGDCTEMAQMMNHLGLNDDQKKQVWTNTELLRCNDLIGFRFIQALESRLLKAKAQGAPFDLVIINPYSVYLGADVTDPRACTEFLNEWLNPVLSKFGVAAVIIHHTPKTNFQNTDQYKIWDWMYWGAGCAGITNWARAILAVKPVSDDFKVFRFIAAKRGKRIGASWNDAFERHFTHSSIPGVLRWEDATAAQVAAATAKAGGHKRVDLDKALAQVPIIDPELKSTVIDKISLACGVGQRPARDALTQLILEQKVLDVPIPNPNPGKNGKKPRSFAGVIQNTASP
jgi:AAA domain-containing protein